MLYFPIVETHYPTWFPFKAGQQFTFFSPVFNLADSSITVGIVAILIFYRGFFEEKQEPIESDLEPKKSALDSDGASEN